MNYKEIIKKIHQRQLETFVLLSNFHKVREHLKQLPTNSSGLYWIWTNLSDNEMLKDLKEDKIAKELDKTPKKVPIKKLIMDRKDLRYNCNIKKNDFRIVYNGLGGTGEKKWGLRSRINQEINTTGQTVGTLNIKNRFTTLEKWGVSFFDFNNKENQDILKQLNSKNIAHKEFIKDLETIWRLEYGFPILCRH